MNGNLIASGLLALSQVIGRGGAEGIDDGLRARESEFEDAQDDLRGQVWTAEIMGLGRSSPALVRVSLLEMGLRNWGPGDAILSQDAFESQILLAQLLVGTPERKFIRGLGLVLLIPALPREDCLHTLVSRGYVEPEPGG